MKKIRISYVGARFKSKKLKNKKTLKPPDVKNLNENEKIKPSYFNFQKKEN